MLRCALRSAQLSDFVLSTRAACQLVASMTSAVGSAGCRGQPSKPLSSIARHSIAVLKGEVLGNAAGRTNGVSQQHTSVACGSEVNAL